MMSKIVVFVLVNILAVSLVNALIPLPKPNGALDDQLYEDVIDPELCDEQLRFIKSDIFLTALFADAGIRLPKGILEGNTLDLGNYHQCLGINRPTPNSELQGKYCMIRVPIDETFDFSFNNERFNFDNKTLKILEEVNAMKTVGLATNGIFYDRSLVSDSPFAGIELRLAICIPKPCTTRQALGSLLSNDNLLGLDYTDQFCRLPNDKPWRAGDTVLVVVVSVIALITVASTSYDIWQTLILKNDPKTLSVIGSAFSVYSNGRRLMRFSSGPGTIQCLDGIRTFAMAWVVMGHTVTADLDYSNPLTYKTWSRSLQAVWVTGMHITVDTFFTLSGFLVVYTTVGKLSGKNLIKNIHLYWLNRLLRMFPLLAAAAFFEATYLNRMTDGPYWSPVASQVERCRASWWSTLLHMQNYANPQFMCIGQAWYLAVDVQLHILSPIILFWVLHDNKKIAWSALVGSLLAVLVASTTFIFIMKFPSMMMAPGRLDENQNYLFYYYVNTLTRASPFLIGMISGYLVSTKRLKLSKVQVACYWVVALSISTFILYANHPIAQVDWDNQVADSLFNSFVRPAWALFIGSLIYMCVNGYAGPINWFLSLSVWKIHSRLSYGMYLFHSALLSAINFTAVTPLYFSIGLMTFKFTSHYAFSFAVSFLMNLVIDAPCSILFKFILGEGVKKKPQAKDVNGEPTDKTGKQV